MAAITANTGSNNWNTDAAWVGAVQPTAADDVTIPASAVVTIPTATTAVCRSCTVQASGTLAFASTTAVLTIGDATAGAGNVALSISGTATITLTGIGTINFISTSATQQTITTGGKTLPNYTINGAGSSYLLSDANTSSGAVTLTTGTFNTNGQTCSWSSFSSTNSNTRTLTLGASAIAITGAGSSWSTLIITGLTFNANTSTITFSGAGVTLSSGGVTFNNVVATGSGTFVISGTLNCANFTRTGTAAKTDAVNLVSLIVASGTVTLTGNSVTNRLLVHANTPGVVRTITAAAASLTNVDFIDITGAGAATWSGTSLGDGQGNSNITFDSPTTQTHDGTTSNWSTAARWTSRVPLPQDTVLIPSGSGTITLDMPRAGGNIDFTGFTGTFASSINWVGYGNLTYSSGMTVTAAFSFSLAGRGSQTITSSGKQLAITTGGLTFIAPGGTYTLNDALSIAGTFTLTSGTVTANNFNVTASVYSMSAGTVNMGTGTWTSTSTATGAIWNVSGATINASTSTIVITGTSANTRTFAGGGKTYNVLRYTIAGSTGQLNITGANTFASIEFSDASNSRSLAFTAGTTTTFTGSGIVGTGAAGRMLEIASITAATHTLTKASGTVSIDYFDITNSIATGGAGWYAGANSGDGGGTSGWIFTAPPAGGGNVLMMGV